MTERTRRCTTGMELGAKVFFAPTSGADVNLETLIAEPGMPSIRCQVGPGSHDCVFVDIIAFEERKEDLTKWLQDIPDSVGKGWQDMVLYTRGNGQMAKLLIVLGDLCGVWVMHPPRGGAIPWNGTHPRILLSHTPLTRSIPKPSSGDLERNAKPCLCCQRFMGPMESTIHDLTEYPGQPQGLCVECGLEGCDTDGSVCRVLDYKAPKAAPRGTHRDAEEEGEAPAQNMVSSVIDEYLRPFS